MDGDAIGLVDGQPIRVDGALPGELVEVEAGPAPAAARIVRILEASPERVVPRCRHAGECGGCAWQHVSYPEQLRQKQRIVADLIRDAVGPALPAVADVVASGGAFADSRGAPWGFRNKVHFVLGAGERGRGVVLGHYRRQSRDVIPVVECPVHVEAGNGTAFAARDVLAGLGLTGAGDDPRTGLVRHLVVRVSEASGEKASTLVVTRDDPRRLKTAIARMMSGADAPDAMHLNVHDRPGPYLFGRRTRRVAGRARLREDVAGVSFLVSPTAFFQTNISAARSLVEIVISALADAGREVLDLYGGAGLFALPLAQRGGRVLVIEESAAAVEDGEASREFNRIAGRSCRFLRTRVESFVAREAGGTVWPGFAPAGVVLDPPREGCAPMLLDRVLARWRPRRVVYVSCNPIALARDLGALRARAWIGHRTAPYRVTAVQPVDMFPHTPHVETVVTLGATAAGGRRPANRPVERASAG